MSRSYRILGIAAAVRVKWQLHVLGKVDQVCDGVVQCQVLQGLRVQVGIR